MPSEAAEYLTTREAAERLKVTENTVRRWLRAGLIQGVRLSDRAGWRIGSQEVTRILRDGLGEELW